MRTSAYNGYWYARAVCDETYDTEKLARHMSEHNTPYSPGVIHGVLKDMINCIKELVLDGKNVKLNDLAIFSVGLKSAGAANLEDFTLKQQKHAREKERHHPHHRTDSHQYPLRRSRSLRAAELQVTIKKLTIKN